MEKLAAYVVREGALTSRDAVGWILRLTNTLAPIHGLGVAHGRVSAKAIQIAESGCEAEGYLLDAGDLVDDPAYQSPERLRRGRPSPEDDCWAIGITLYSVLSGQLPFRGTTAGEVLARIDEAPPSPLAVFDLGDDQLQQVLDRLLARDPSQRLTTLDELRASLAAWDRSLAKLPGLRFGKPSDDDGFDDDEAVMTAVYRFRDEDVPAQARKPRPAAGSRPGPSAAIPHDEKGPRPITNAPPEPDADGDVDVDAEEEVKTSVRVPEPPGLSTETEDPPAPSARVPKAADASMRSGSTPSDGGPSSDEAQDHGSDGSGPRPGPILDQPSSSSPVVSSSSWPPKRDVVLAEAHAATSLRRQRFQRLVLLGALLLGAVGGAVYMTVLRPEASNAPTTAGSVAPEGTGETNAAPPTPGSAAPTTSATTPHATVAAGGAGSGGGDPAIGAGGADAADGSGGAARMGSSGGADGTGGGSEVAAAPDAGGADAGGADAGAGSDSVDACAVKLFPDDTFAVSDPRFAFTCTEPNPVAGASQLRQLVVASRGDQGVTHGMREWAMMGWYGMAAFTVLRARCCEAPVALATPTSHKQCLLDERLTALANAVKERKELAAQEAMKDYGKSIYCLVNSGASHFFDQKTVPRGGELTTFGKTLARALKP